MRAKFKLSAYGLHNVEFVETDAAHMPFEEPQFDLIISNLGINNFEDPAGVLAECFRVTKPGGRIALTSNIKGHMEEFYSVFKKIIRIARIRL